MLLQDFSIFEQKRTFQKKASSPFKNNVCSSSVTNHTELRYTFFLLLTDARLFFFCVNQFFWVTFLFTLAMSSGLNVLSIAHSHASRRPTGSWRCSRSSVDVCFAFFEWTNYVTLRFSKRMQLLLSCVTLSTRVRNKSTLLYYSKTDNKNLSQKISILYLSRKKAALKNAQSILPFKHKYLWIQLLSVLQIKKRVFSAA